MCIFIYLERIIMQKKLIGRKKEQETLQMALTSERSELVAVVGRRRVGKTFLIKHTYASHFDFELTGLQHASKSDQLQNFLFALKSFFPDFLIEGRPKSWLEAFYFLSKALEEQKKQEIPEQKEVQL